jgi:hypothetical protein
MVLAILSRPHVWEKVEGLAAALLECDELFAWIGLAEFLPEGDRRNHPVEGQPGLHNILHAVYRRRCQASIDTRSRRPDTAPLIRPWR